MFTQVHLTTGEDRAVWNEFTLSPPVRTSRVKITICTQPRYTADNKYIWCGFYEVEFYNELFSPTTGKLQALTIMIHSLIYY